MRFMHDLFLIHDDHYVMCISPAHAISAEVRHLFGGGRAEGRGCRGKCRGALVEPHHCWALRVVPIEPTVIAGASTVGMWVQCHKPQGWEW